MNEELIGSVVGIVIGCIGVVLSTYLAWTKGKGYGPSLGWYFGSQAIYLAIAFPLMILIFGHC